MLEGIIAQALLNEDTITACLGKYNNAPSIFCDVAVPQMAEYPAVLITAATAGDFSCRDQGGADLTFDLKLFSNKKRTEKTLRETAILIWNFLDRSDLSPYMEEAGYENWGCLCDAPIRHDDEDGFPGYRMNLKLSFLQS